MPSRGLSKRYSKYKAVLIHNAVTDDSLSAVRCK